jgi:hypothetical protein
MTSNLAKDGVADAPVLDPTDAPRQDSMQQAELQRALLVYGMAGALGADQARSAVTEPRG